VENPIPATYQDDVGTVSPEGHSAMEDTLQPLDEAQRAELRKAEAVLTNEPD
jgi:hypothetical protein